MFDRMENAQEHQMEQLLDLDHLPTAIVTSNDLMAFGAMEAAQERGLVVGHDIAVIGFDDVPLAEHFRPPLTIIHQPIYDIGKMICQMLIEIRRGEDLVERQIILQPELVIRQSSGTGQIAFGKGVIDRLFSLVKA